jgi:cyclopropane-fatty-acyl-phospholipid synthase
MLLTNGSLGFAESYIRGDWTSPDLTALLELAARNFPSLEPVIGQSRWSRALRRLWHKRRENTRRGSRRNIAFHYDLGNDFYSEWLDTGMSYSSAIYSRPDESLENAQARKLDCAVGLLDLRRGDRVLEVGCGWGGLAETLIRRGAGHVTAITLSSQQLDYAQQRLRRLGLSDSADLRLQDYRDVESQFDGIVSIEMLEAVGEAYWAGYFDMIAQRLKPTGRAVIQVITLSASRFARYQKSVDFIQRYVFPGGMLPTDEIVRAESARAGLALRSVERFGASYALTLAEWRRRFNSAWPTIRNLGFDERFRRTWEYYLSYCEAGFRAGVLEVGLYCFTKPAAAQGLTASPIRL